MRNPQSKLINTDEFSTQPSTQLHTMIKSQIGLFPYLAKVISTLKTHIDDEKTLKPLNFLNLTLSNLFTIKLWMLLILKKQFWINMKENCWIYRLKHFQFQSEQKRISYGEKSCKSIIQRVKLFRINHQQISWRVSINENCLIK